MLRQGLKRKSFLAFFAKKIEARQKRSVLLSEHVR
jgi:hypothetical protein